MYYTSYLLKATLMKRLFNFMAEVVLPNKQKIMLRCPNLSELPKCDILGTRVWYTRATGEQCLPTWELAEVDGGHLVCINPEMVKPLVVDAIKRNVIEDFSEYNVIHVGLNIDQVFNKHLLLEQDGKRCHIFLEQVLFSDPDGRGYFPRKRYLNKDHLLKLIKTVKEGHRGVILFCVMNTQIKDLMISNNVDDECGKLLKEAIDRGVELIAYKAAINLSEIELASKIPIFFCEDMISN